MKGSFILKLCLYAILICMTFVNSTTTTTTTGGATYTNYVYLTKFSASGCTTAPTDSSTSYTLIPGATTTNPNTGTNYLPLNYFAESTTNCFYLFTTPSSSTVTFAQASAACSSTTAAFTDTYKLTCDGSCSQFALISGAAYTSTFYYTCYFMTDSTTIGDSALIGSFSDSSCLTARGGVTLYPFFKSISNSITQTIATPSIQTPSNCVKLSSQSSMLPGTFSADGATYTGTLFLNSNYCSAVWSATSTTISRTFSLGCTTKGTCAKNPLDTSTTPEYFYCIRFTKYGPTATQSSGYLFVFLSFLSFLLVL